MWNLVDNVRDYMTAVQPAVTESVTFAPDGFSFAVGSAGGECTIWHTETGLLLKSIAAHQGTIFGVQYTTDGKRIITGGADGMIRIWDVAGGTNLHTYSGHPGGTMCVKLSPDGKTLLTTGMDGWAKIWSVPPAPADEPAATSTAGP